MKLFIRVFLLLFIISAIVGGYWFYQNRIATPVSAAGNGTFTQIVPVRQGSLSSNLSVVGELDAAQSQDLSFSQISGTAELQKLEVAAGNTVKQGQVLASIDAAPYQQAVDQAKSDLQAAEKKLSDLNAAPTQLQFAQADLAVSKAQQDVEQAKQDLADLQKPDLTSLQTAVQDAQNDLDLSGLDEQLAERDSLAKSQRDLEYTIDWYMRRIRELDEKPKKNLEETQELTDRQKELTEAQVDLARVQAQRELAQTSLGAQKAADQLALAEAQKYLAEAKKGGDPLAVSKGQLGIKQAEVALASAQDDRAQLDKGPDPTGLAAAQADVDKKRLALSDAERALAGAQLVAPFDGTVLKTDLSVADQVTANTVVLTLANLKQLQVVAAVDETTIRRVAQGQTAEISFDAFPGQTFKGTVQAVPLQGELQGDVMVYQVPLTLEGAEKLPLLIGMTANVAIQTEQAENTLLVPTMALQRVNGGYQVRLVDTDNPQGQPVPVEVQVGLSDGMYTQITSGLQEGDQVVVVELQASTQSNNPFQRGFNVQFGGGGGFGGGGNFQNNNQRNRTTNP